MGLYENGKPVTCDPAIKAKTDNLPSDPASETNVDANETKIDTVDTVLDNIKTITDAIPDSGAMTSIAQDSTVAKEATIGSPAGADLATDIANNKTVVDAIQEDLGNPSSRANLKTIEAMLGNPDIANQSFWDALAGAGGLATFPAATAAANNVSIAEVTRYIQEVCLGVPTEDLATDLLTSQVIGKKSDTVAGTSIVALVKQLLEDVGNASARTNLKTLIAMLGNPDAANATLYDAIAGTSGIPAMPAAAAPANDVSIAQMIRDIWDVLRNGTGGSEPATNKSMVDIIGTDGAVSLLNLLLGASGDKNSILGTKKTFSKAAVLDNVQNILFTISGGKVIITNIILEIHDAAVDNEAVNTKLIYNPTVGTDTDLCANADLDSAIVGTNLGITGTLTDALQFAPNGGMTVKPSIYPNLAEGTIDILSSADGGDGGATLSAEIWYYPLDAGAAIT